MRMYYTTLRLLGSRLIWHILIVIGSNNPALMIVYAVKQ